MWEELVLQVRVQSLLTTTEPTLIKRGLHPVLTRALHVLTAFFYLITVLPGTTSGAGICSAGVPLAVSPDPHIAACSGAWSGHVTNASALCGSNWRVCGALSDAHLLATVSWATARHLPGCYAFNGAHDGGQCRECRADRQDQDNLGGVGAGCAYWRRDDTSCLGEGRVDARGCCTEVEAGAGCTHTQHISGVLCCQLPGEAPRMLVRPEPLTHVESGATFVLSCQASGRPAPTTRWSRQGQPLPTNNTRLRATSSGYLLISEARPSDSGLYQCVAKNLAGTAVAAATVLVTDYASGCADGTTDALQQYDVINACRGAWRGHVKRGRQLCARGWHVCSPRHVTQLELLSPDDVLNTSGCYAYNAENTPRGCLRCHREALAGLGAGCGRWRHYHNYTCLTQGRLDVPKHQGSKPCHYEAGVTTGVLCCKRPKTPRRTTPPEASWPPGLPYPCDPGCEHGGSCVAPNTCRCSRGYKGAWCQHPVCEGGCVPNSYCVQPGVCRCRAGHTFAGDRCVPRRQPCKHACFYGGVCKHGHCKCPRPYHGKWCHLGGEPPGSELGALKIDRETGHVSLLQTAHAQKRPGEQQLYLQGALTDSQRQAKSNTSS